MLGDLPELSLGTLAHALGILGVERNTRPCEVAAVLTDPRIDTALVIARDLETTIMAVATFCAVGCQNKLTPGAGAGFIFHPCGCCIHLLSTMEWTGDIVDNRRL